MASLKLKTVYVLFFASFPVWLSVLFSVCFPSGTWANPVKFPNLSLLAMFLGSAVVASFSCLSIGLDYLGLGLRFRARPVQASQKQEPRLPIPEQRPAKTTKSEKRHATANVHQDELNCVLLVPQLKARVPKKKPGKRQNK